MRLGVVIASPAGSRGALGSDGVGRLGCGYGPAGDQDAGTGPRALLPGTRCFSRARRRQALFHRWARDLREASAGQDSRGTFSRDYPDRRRGGPCDSADSSRARVGSSFSRRDDSQREVPQRHDVSLPTTRRKPSKPRFESRLITGLTRTKERGLLRAGRSSCAISSKPLLLACSWTFTPGAERRMAFSQRRSAVQFTVALTWLSIGPCRSK